MIPVDQTITVQLEPPNDLEECEERVAELRALVRSATSFKLGHHGDDDARDYVSVHRQYGVPTHEQWAVVHVSRSRGMVLDTALQCKEQSVALFHGRRMLNAIRRAKDEQATSRA